MKLYVLNMWYVIFYCSRHASWQQYKLPCAPDAKTSVAWQNEFEALTDEKPLQKYTISHSHLIIKLKNQAIFDVSYVICVSVRSLFLASWCIRRWISTNFQEMCTYVCSPVTHQLVSNPHSSFIHFSLFDTFCFSIVNFADKLGKRSFAEVGDTNVFALRVCIRLNEFQVVVHWTANEQMLFRLTRIQIQLARKYEIHVRTG